MAELPALFAEPHRRYDPLRDEWVLVSPGRTNRPWQGGEERLQVEQRPPFDPACYLCPGNTRANGETNPAYATTYVFTNDFAALRPATSDAVLEDGLLRAEGEQGTCRVICFSPRHDLTLAGMDPADVRRVIDLWAAQTAELGARYRWVQVFENRGEAMGASNPHPHGQVWAGTALPTGIAREDASQRAYHARIGRQLLADVAAQETGGPRVVDENEDWLVLVPFWAVWPFEVLVVPKRSFARMPDLDDAARDALAAILGATLRRYDALFGVPFPYSLGWHGAPFGDDADEDAWRLHGHAYPPLLRSATVRKFMVGYELLAEAQRDVTPEDAAARLRAVGSGR
ncbi:MAG TPA: UDP-glucose--hexose-1-phosphate uridylyltransferase [Candidatus Limnocylindrales bacterium]|nr:UDP-glucose--hexose-1-phosphate uridylyltransferase [Candidatus Limnocylindrales bacterium]